MELSSMSEVPIDRTPVKVVESLEWSLIKPLITITAYISNEKEIDCVLEEKGVSSH